MGLTKTIKSHSQVSPKISLSNLEARVCFFSQVFHVGAVNPITV